MQVDLLLVICSKCCAPYARNESSVEALSMQEQT